MLHLNTRRTGFFYDFPVKTNGNSVYLPDDFKRFLIGYAQSARNGFKYWRSEANWYDHNQQKSYCWGKAYEEIEFYQWIKGVVRDYLDGYIDTDYLIDRAESMWENRYYSESDAIHDLLKTIFAYKGAEWYYDGGEEERELDLDEYYDSLYIA